MKYLRKTNEVEAIQFTKENFDDFLEIFLGKNEEGVIFTDEMKERIINTGFEINSQSGEQKIRKNDWLVIDNNKPIIYSDNEFKKVFITTLNIN